MNVGVIAYVEQEVKMHISFVCPCCGNREKIRVITVGWKQLRHQCSSCGIQSIHQLRRFASAGLWFIGAMACWGIAFNFKMIFSLSSDITLLIFFSAALVLVYFLAGKTVDICSSWRAVGKPDNSIAR